MSLGPIDHMCTSVVLHFMPTTIDHFGWLPEADSRPLPLLDTRQQAAMTKAFFSVCPAHDQCRNSECHCHDGATLAAERTTSVSDRHYSVKEICML